MGSVHSPENPNACSVPPLCKILLRQVSLEAVPQLKGEMVQQITEFNRDTEIDTLSGCASDFIGSPVKDKADLIFLLTLFAAFCARLFISTSLHPYSNFQSFALLAALRQPCGHEQQSTHIPRRGVRILIHYRVSISFHTHAPQPSWQNAT